MNELRGPKTRRNKNQCTRKRKERDRKGKDRIPTVDG